jgi:hypothetical protein
MPWSHMDYWRYSSTSLHALSKMSPVPIELEVGKPQIRSGCCGEQKNFLTRNLTPMALFSTPSSCQLSHRALRSSSVYQAGSELLAAVVVKSPIFWDIMPYSPYKVNRRFGGTCRHFQGGIIGQATNQLESGSLQVRLTFSELHCVIKSRNRAVGIATGYGLDDQGVGVRVPVGTRIFNFPCRPDRLCGPPGLLSNG